MAAALLDRITHKAHIIECAWESYRLRQTLKEGKETGRAVKSQQSGNTE